MQQNHGEASRLFVIPFRGEKVKINIDFTLGVGFIAFMVGMAWARVGIQPTEPATPAEWYFPLLMLLILEDWGVPFGDHFPKRPTWCSRCSHKGRLPVFGSTQSDPNSHPAKDVQP